MVASVGSSSFSQDWQSVLSLQDQATQNVMTDVSRLVDRKFETPDAMDHLSSLSGAQKLAMLRDTMQAKADLQGFLNQYGDNVDDHGAMSKLDSNINTLKNDHDVLTYMNWAVGTNIATQVQTPEHSTLRTHLQADYMADIVKGGALRSALQAGKSPEDAIKSYLSEAGLLASVLPKDFLADHAKAAQNALSEFTLNQQINGIPDDVDLDGLVAAGGQRLSKPSVDVSPGWSENAVAGYDGASPLNSTILRTFSGAGFGGTPENRRDIRFASRGELSLIARTPSDFPQQMANTFGPAIQSLTNQIAANAHVTDPAEYQKIAADVTKTFADAWNKVRAGMKLEDALLHVEAAKTGPVPPRGVSQEVYHSGIAKAASALLGGGALAAKYAGNVHSPQDVATLVAGSVSQFGGLLEAGGKFLNPKNPLPLFGGTGDGSWREQLNKSFGAGNIEKAGKALGAVGGLAGAGISFFMAQQSMKNGDTVSTMLNMVDGVAGAVGTASATLEGLNSITGGKLANVLGSAFKSGTAEAGAIAVDASALVQGAFKTALATVGDMASIVGGLASLGLGLWDMAKGAKAYEKSADVVDSELSRLVGVTTEWVDKTDPSFIW